MYVLCWELNLVKILQVVEVVVIETGPVEGLTGFILFWGVKKVKTELHNASFEREVVISSLLGDLFGDAL